jgi:hypothetical protein
MVTKEEGTMVIGPFSTFAVPTWVNPHENKGKKSAIKKEMKNFLMFYSSA